MNGPNGRFNQDGALRPVTSPYGQAFHALVHGHAFVDAPQGAAERDTGGRHAAVWEFAPILPDPVYLNLLGGFAQRPAKVLPVLGAYDSYDGILPLGQQPAMDKPWPWQDPTRGQP